MQVYTIKYDASQPSFSYTYINNSEDFWIVIDELFAYRGIKSLDLETKSLYPEANVDNVRITTISTKHMTYVIDHDKSMPFKQVAEIFTAMGVFYVFNVCFEGRWFDDAVAPSVSQQKGFILIDTGIMRKSIKGGGPISLAKIAKWDLDYDMDKDLQNSNWSRPDLTEDQIKYAAIDGEITLRLAIFWGDQMTDKHWYGCMILNDCWRAVNEMSDTGFLIDVDYHYTLIDMWQRRANSAFKVLRKYTPENVIQNLRSKKQISDFLKSVFDEDAIAAWDKTDKTEQLKTDRDTLRIASRNSPYPMSRWLAAMMVFTRAEKYLSTYGETLINAQNLAGKVYPRYNIAQAITNRFSSSGAMNAQNLPNAPYVRRSFIAPPGCVKIIADYSGVELRVLAFLADDKDMIYDVVYGNMHAERAIDMFRHNRDEFMAALKKKEYWAVSKRKRAKAFSFQLTYGAGDFALSMSLRCSIEEAHTYVAKWARAYPRAYDYRNRMFNHMKATGYLELVTGNTIYVPRQDRTMPVAANYPIQGAAAMVMYAAITHCHRLLVERKINAVMLSTVHDEILLVCADDDVEIENAKAALKEAMELGWLDVFPDTTVDNLLEIGVGYSWAEK